MFYRQRIFVSKVEPNINPLLTKCCSSISNRLVLNNEHCLSTYAASMIAKSSASAGQKTKGPLTSKVGCLTKGAAAAPSQEPISPLASRTLPLVHPSSIPHHNLGISGSWVAAWWGNSRVVLDSTNTCLLWNTSIWFLKFHWQLARKQISFAKTICTYFFYNSIAVLWVFLIAQDSFKSQIV